MSNLTSERVNGIKSGYWSMYTKEIVVQKLGEIEHKMSPLISRVCDECCRWIHEMGAEELEDKCAACPCVAIDNMISGKENNNE